MYQIIFGGFFGILFQILFWIFVIATFTYATIQVKTHITQRREFGKEYTNSTSLVFAGILYGLGLLVLIFAILPVLYDLLT